MRKLLLAFGLIAVVVVGSLMPAGAHHRSSTARLNDRVDRLTNQVRTLQNKVSVLQDKTSLLDREGFYLGFVAATQVLSQCAPATNAIWEPNEIDPTLNIQWIDDCFVPAELRAEAKKLLEAESGRGSH